MANTSAVRDARTAAIGWRRAAAAVIVCVLACGTTQADVEYVDFCDYYPLAVGNLWRAEWGTLLAIEGEVTGRLTVNGVVVWEVTWRVLWGGEVSDIYEMYEFFVGGYFYSLYPADPQVLASLPELPTDVEPLWAQRHPVGTPLDMPNGDVVVAHRGTLADMCAAFGGHVSSAIGDQSDTIVLVRNGDSFPPIYVRDVGLVGCGSVPGVIIDPAGPALLNPVTPILNEGCPNPLFLTSTNLGEVWEAGTVQTVTWQRDTEVAGPDIRIGLHKGAAFIEWIIRQTPNDGEYAWMIPPDLAPGDDYRLRIQSFTDNTIRDYSDGTFSITSPALALTVPNGGEALQAVDTQTIAWLGDAPIVGPDVRLGLHRGATFVGWITRRTSNDGEFNWTIPDDLPAAANYRLRIQSFTDSAIRDFSDRRFAIVR